MSAEDPAPWSDIPTPLAALLAHVETRLRADRYFAAAPLDSEMEPPQNRRVFGQEIPPFLIKSMPTESVRISYADGAEQDVAGMDFQALDCECVAPTFDVAARLHRDLQRALQAVGGGGGAGGVRYLRRLAGPVRFRDEKHRWPIIWSSWRMAVNPLSRSPEPEPEPEPPEE